jgi:septal ring factor EnvC (AmiA/AmiB activator)
MDQNETSAYTINFPALDLLSRELASLRGQMRDLTATIEKASRQSVDLLRRGTSSPGSEHELAQYDTMITSARNQLRHVEALTYQIESQRSEIAQQLAEVTKMARQSTRQQNRFTLIVSLITLLAGALLVELINLVVQFYVH